MRKTARLVMLMSIGLGIAASGWISPQRSGAAEKKTPRATLSDAEGKVIGEVTFWPASQHKAFVHVEIFTATPGFHGVHIHANDQKLGCVAPTFASVGGHWVMSGDGAHGEHTGDMPNVLVNQDGTGHLWFVADAYDLRELAGRAMIFHAEIDNHGHVPVSHAPTAYSANAPEALTLTHNTGNAGARVACGVIAVK